MRGNYCHHSYFSRGYRKSQLPLRRITAQQTEGKLDNKPILIHLASIIGIHGLLKTVDNDDGVIVYLNGLDFVS